MRYCLLPYINNRISGAIGEGEKEDGAIKFYLTTIEIEISISPKMCVERMALPWAG
jgi:hypothetical protein